MSVGISSGAIAAVAGFGIGSLLTPILSQQIGTKLAVAAVAIPHLLGTALRSWLLREPVDRHKRIPENLFYRIVEAIVMMLGIWMFLMH